MQCSVTDTGPGIPVAVQKAVFQPFSQLDSEDASRDGGVGLGLAICKRLAALMGGEIQRRSAPDEGSTFTLVLEDVNLAEPLPPPERATAGVMQQLEFRSARILITDDDRSSRLLLQEYLQPLGFDLIQAEDGE